MAADPSLPDVDPERECELYTAFTEATPLLPAHRAELRTKRGFSDDTIDRCRFRSGGEHVFDIVREIQKHTHAEDYELVSAGLLAPSKKDGALYANGQLAGDRIIIPYLRADGRAVYHLRPHKLGFSGRSVRLYSEHLAVGWATSDVLILTEGEFKAAAAAQLGYRALAVPGISSFAGQHFERLRTTLRDIPHKRCVILFDRETKADPALPGYKDDFRKRYDVEWYSWLLADRLSVGPATVKIGVLPTEWMENGKADLDGALAQGRTRADLKRVIDGAFDPDPYINQLEEEAGGVIARRRRKYKGKDKVRSLSIFDSRASGCGYTWMPEGEDAKPEIVSDFLVQLERMVQTDEQVERVVRLVNQNGERSKPLVVQPTDMSSVRAWRQWAAAQGDYNWWGKQHHLDYIWSYLHNQHDGSLIRRTVLGGEIDPGLWLFQNGVITQGRFVAPRDEDGLTWVGRHGYEMAEPEGQPVALNPDPESARVLGDTHRELLELLERNLSAPTGWFALGWGMATLFSRPLFNRHKCFPILFNMGEAGSGKTTMAHWLMNGFFGISTTGKPMMSTEKSQYRLLAKRCSVAAWFDEFRESRDTARHVTAFCSIYNRQAYARAKRTGDLQTDSVPVNGSLMLGGVMPPHDDQLQSRCLFLHYDADRRDNRDEDDGGTYPQIEARLHEFNDFMLSALLRYDELKPRVMEFALEFQKGFVKRGASARMALNYAMPVAAFHAVCGDLVDSAKLLEFAIETMTTSVDRLAGDHPLTDFWDSVSTMAAKGQLGPEHLGSDGTTIWIWLTGTFQEYEAQFRRRRDKLSFTQNDVTDWISKQSYYVTPLPDKSGKRRRNVQKRLGGTKRWCLAIKRHDAPPQLIEAVETMNKPDLPPDTPVWESGLGAQGE